VRLAIGSCRPLADVRAKQVQRAGREDIGSRARRRSTPSGHDCGALVSTGPCLHRDRARPPRQVPLTSERGALCQVEALAHSPDLRPAALLAFLTVKPTWRGLPPAATSARYRPARSFCLRTFKIRILLRPVLPLKTSVAIRL